MEYCCSTTDIRNDCTDRDRLRGLQHVFILPVRVWMTLLSDYAAEGNLNNPATRNHIRVCLRVRHLYVNCSKTILTNNRRCMLILFVRRSPDFDWQRSTAEMSLVICT